MSEQDNRYAPPTATVADPAADPSDAILIPNGRMAPIGDGAKWISQGLSMFFKRPGMWIVTGLLLFVIFAAASAVPLANLATTLLWPAFSAGVVYAADVQRRTGAFSINDLFHGFGPKLSQFVIVGAVMLVSSVLMLVVIAIIVGIDVALATFGIKGALDPTAMTKTFWLAFLTALALALPIMAATYLAAPLIELHGLSAADAMKMSFVGSLKNILPGLVFSILLLLLVIVSIIPLGLGLLVTGPVMLITFYTMYRGIFVRES